MGASAAKWCPSLRAGAEAASKTKLYNVRTSPPGRITLKLSVMSSRNGPAQSPSILILAIILRLLILYFGPANKPHARPIAD